jgi:hypothetical protein
VLPTVSASLHVHHGPDSCAATRRPCWRQRRSPEAGLAPGGRRAGGGTMNTTLRTGATRSANTSCSSTSPAVRSATRPIVPARPCRCSARSSPAFQTRRAAALAGRRGRVAAAAAADRMLCCSAGNDRLRSLCTQPAHTAIQSQQPCLLGNRLPRTLHPRSLSRAAGRARARLGLAHTCGTEGAAHLAADLGGHAQRGALPPGQRVARLGLGLGLGRTRAVRQAHVLCGTPGCQRGPRRGR